jgi:hypothetical protein
MTDTNRPKIELVYTDADGKKRVLVSNTQVIPAPGKPATWSITHLPSSLEGIDWSILRAASYLCLHAACERLPVEPQWGAGVAAVAAYRASEGARKDPGKAVGHLDGGIQLEYLEPSMQRGADLLPSKKGLPK